MCPPSSTPRITHTHNRFFFLSSSYTLLCDLSQPMIVRLLVISTSFTIGPDVAIVSWFHCFGPAFFLIVFLVHFLIQCAFCFVHSISIRTQRNPLICHVSSLQISCSLRVRRCCQHLFTFNSRISVHTLQTAVTSCLDRTRPLL